MAILFFRLTVVFDDGNRGDVVGQFRSVAGVGKDDAEGATRVVELVVVDYSHTNVRFSGSVRKRDLSLQNIRSSRSA